MDREELNLLLEMAEQLMTNGKASNLVAELADSGMAEAIWADERAWSALFELQGKHPNSSTLIDLVALREVWIEQGLRLVLPRVGSFSPPGFLDGDQLIVDGVLISDTACAGYLIGVEDGSLVVVDSSQLSASPTMGFDPELGIVRVFGRVCLAECLPAPRGTTWDDLAATASRAFGYELLGIAEAVLHLATQHVRDRRQFGQPIASFQVVRHRLADAFIQVTAARELLDAVRHNPPGRAQVLVSKAVAGRAALSAVQVAQQVCGAMGFTWEYGLHRFVRRAYLIDSLLGGSEAAPERIGALFASGEHDVPRLVAL